ncbi:CPBP family intramembrane metalloprotease [Panacibacter sp. DH6]|uniref:CPBP family intramembrane metalloprotease n=1 Tax=Panacibacter microcysteis TaxID=2793269 RepID=A0A931E6L3_9BACT|nr:type II CAAX endopeptidase family protein [Panacibacter microcysteis]MBG9376416.1 CPBP family intramembrane metalloprotease [Panacibacter microcysteis]
MEPDQDTYYCDDCDTSVKGYHRFCHHCGAYLGTDAGRVDIFNNRHLRGALVFYTIYLFFCLTVRFTNWFTSYDSLFFVEISLAAVTVYFAWRNRATIKPVLKFNNFNVLVLLGVIAGSVAFSTVISLTIKQINVSIFQVDTSLFEPYRIYQFPVLVMIYSIAFMPAVFEEIAFRSVLYNYFNAFLDERMVVMITGFIFAAIHLNFFSLVWLIPFGILIGSLRRKYNTLWYGIIFHFVFNLTACLIDLYGQNVF